MLQGSGLSHGPISSDKPVTILGICLNSSSCDSYWSLTNSSEIHIEGPQVESIYLNTTPNQPVPQVPWQWAVEGLCQSITPTKLLLVINSSLLKEI